MSSARTARSSERSASITDEEDSSGTGVHLSPSSAIDSQDSSDREEYTDSASGGDFDDPWTELSKADVGPSESASRPSTSNHHRLPHLPLRHHSRREASHRHPHPSRAHRHPQPSSPESVGSNEELAYGHDLSRRRPYSHWASAGGQSYQYAPSYSGQSYSPYPSSSVIPPGQQLVPFNSPPSNQYPYSPYQQQPPPLPPQPPGSHHPPGYFPHGHHGIPSHMAGGPGPMGVPLPPHADPRFPNPDLMHHGPPLPGYFPFPPQGYPIPHPLAPSPVYSYQPALTAPSPVQTPPTSAPPIEVPKDDGYAELKQMLLQDKLEREAREAAAKRAELERIAAVEAAKARADEIAAAADAAAKAATTEAEKKAAEAEKKAAEKAAEEATKMKTEAEEAVAKAKTELEEAAAKAKAEADDAAAKAKVEADDAAAKAKADQEAAVAAALAAATPAPPEEKRKPIKFKDAVGRKFSFPFHLCCTWEGMEDLIRQAFLHVDIIGPHVAEGHYDLIGPNNEIILPGVWETVIEPDWTITMHMWPMPEPPKEEEPPPPPIEVIEVVAPPPPEEGKKKGKSRRSAAPHSDAPPPPPPPPPPPGPDGVVDVPPAVAKKKPAKPGGSFWFPAPRAKKAPKAAKKP